MQKGDNLPIVRRTKQVIIEAESMVGAPECQLHPSVLSTSILTHCGLGTFSETQMCSDEVPSSTALYCASYANISLDSQLPPRRQGLVQVKWLTECTAYTPTSEDMEAAFLHILRGQWALGLPVSGKLFPEETKSMEITDYLNGPRNILRGPVCSACSFLVKTSTQSTIMQWKK